MTCDDCQASKRCFERRGICRDFVDYKAVIKRAKEDIEHANEMRSKKTTGPAPQTDKTG